MNSHLPPLAASCEVSSLAVGTPAGVAFKSFVFLAASLASAGMGLSAPLTATTAIQVQPDPSAPSIGVLSAGTEPPPAPAEAPAAPEGWQAVSVPGPFEAYVENKNLGKGLDVIPGSPLYLAPKPGSGVLELAVKGDKITITGLHGNWTQVRVDKTIVGYIHSGPLPGAVPASVAPVVAASAPGPAASVPTAPPPMDSVAAVAGKPAADSASEQSGAPLTRYFEGQFVSTKRLLAPARPYEWQLIDASGTRTAYLDIAKLLLTAQVGTFVGREVTVYGTVTRVPGTSDLVVAVESLQLKSQP